jgi:hypothetical protein
MGETYDFEYTPLHKGTLRLELRGSVGGQKKLETDQLLFRVPIRVE